MANDSADLEAHSPLTDTPWQRARDFAIAAHGFQRYGGRPYAFHLDQVAARVQALGHPYLTVAYLHDVLEDTGVDREDIEREFGPVVARCVATISDPENRSREERKSIINRQLAAVAEHGPDWPALVVKVADRLCNIKMCEFDGRHDLLERYKREHPDFRAAAWRPQFREDFDHMEEILARHTAGGTDGPSDGPAHAAADLVSEFVSSFSEQWEAYLVLARENAERCEGILLGHGIQAIVSSRAKSPERLRAKILRRQGERGRPYASAEEIFSDIVDLAGVRIALYFPDDAEIVEALLRRNFDVIGSKQHEGDQPPTGDYTPRFSGYWATHFRVRSDLRGREVTSEIQLASVLMHAFAHVAHDLIYKPQSGSLSWTEYALLDQLNGLVLAGETALDQLHKAIRARLRRHDAPMSDHFELGAWLTRWMRLHGRDESSLGRVDRLFELLRETEQTRPSEIEPLLADLPPNTPVADRVVERLLLQQPERAAQWRSALSATAVVNPYDAQPPMAASGVAAISELLSAWAELERAAAKRLTGRVRKSFPIGRKRVAALGLSEARVDALRQAREVYRDVARHGGRFDAAAQREAAATLRALSAEIRAEADEAMR